MLDPRIELFSVNETQDIMSNTNVTMCRSNAILYFHIVAFSLDHFEDTLTKLGEMDKVGQDHPKQH